MDEMRLKQSIKDAYTQIRAPEKLIRSVVLRAEAVTMGRHAQERVAQVCVEEQAELAARVIVGRLAAVTQLPEGSEPAALARHLAQQPGFTRLLEGGEVPQRLADGSLLRHLAQQTSAGEEIPREKPPVLEGPAL